MSKGRTAVTTERGSGADWGVGRQDGHPGRL